MTDSAFATDAFIQSQIARWMRELGSVRRLAPKTLEAYGRDLSQFMSLLPGDIISTGTPPGVGLGMKPARFLKAGEVMELGIAGLGQQRQMVRADD